MEEKYDTALLGILQHEGKIERFLDVMFGFLFRRARKDTIILCKYAILLARQRVDVIGCLCYTQYSFICLLRTDFYRIMKSKEDKLGFPPGVASKMIASIYKKYETLASSIEKTREKQREQMERTKLEQKTEQTNIEKKEKQPEVPEVVDKIVEVETEKSSASELKTDTNTVKDEKTDRSQSSSVSDGSETVQESQEDVMTDAELDSKMAKGDANNEGETKADKKAIDPRTGEEDVDPELTRQQQEFQADPESYNGARRENYRWAQSITDLDLRVNVPSHIKKGRDVRVETGNKHVKVEYKDTTSAWVVAVDSDMSWEVHKDETVWSLVPGDHIHINLEKKEERWWEAFFTDEPKISVRKIDASRPMSDLDQEAQAKIEEMMYNDRQKKLGLPQTHEAKMHDMLRKAWDAEGSPFKGQPFDPSKFSVDPSGVMKMNN